MWVAVTGAILGIASGVRHAMEPDHLAAVSTFVAEQRTPRATVTFAAAWGFGHALMLLFVGGALMLLGREMPPALADVFELGVSFMLVGLGVRGLVHALRAYRGELVQHHRHDGLPTHTHVGRPLIVGLMHGLAGSGALTALVLGQVGSPVAGLGFMALYGFGAMLGMALLAGVAGVPLARIVRSPLGMPIMLAVTGAISLVVGASWGAPLAMRMLG
ncbi:hypothetical protein LZC95_47375 [Pendulispora brunnea]|uniref:Urease accessory protein n=1 Tax=Pendulispora brunnea TaxID=2905690 RepID=A0ABZ2K5U0_9BACT